MTTGDSRKGRLGVIFVFSVRIHVCIFGGDEIVLFKYSGKYVNIYFNMKITFLNFLL